MTHRSLYRLAALFRFTAKTLALWPTWVTVAFFTFTTGPHVWIGDDNCTYLGSRGLVAGHYFFRCHWIVIMDSSEVGR